MLRRYVFIGCPQIAWKFVPKFLRAIQNCAIWIYTSERAENWAIASNCAYFTFRSNIFGPKSLPHYSETALFVDFLYYISKIDVHYFQVHYFLSPLFPSPLFPSPLFPSPLFPRPLFPSPLFQVHYFEVHYFQVHYFEIVLYIASSMLCELLRVVFFCCCLIPSLTHVIESVFQWMAKCITLNEFAILSKGIYGLLKIRAVFNSLLLLLLYSNLSAKLTPSQIPKKNKDFYDVRADTLWSWIMYKSIVSEYLDCMKKRDFLQFDFFF